jgi:microcystin-dependent protein
MSTPFIAQIIMFGGNFAIRGFALCNGQLISIAQEQALFALIGTTYGGDGQVTFALPNLQSRNPNHQGQGPGLSSYVMGQMSGVESVTLTQQQLPAHTHAVNATTVNGNVKNPTNAIPAAVQGTNTNIYSASSPDVAMNNTMVGTSGGNLPHENMQPYLVINFQIALEGIFPSRN